jgi:hypothetical protein
MRSMGGVERSETFPEQHPERNANKKRCPVKPGMTEGSYYRMRGPYRRITRFWDSP